MAKVDRALVYLRREKRLGRIAWFHFGQSCYDYGWGVQVATRGLTARVSEYVYRRDPLRAAREAVASVCAIEKAKKGKR